MRDTTVEKIFKQNGVDMKDAEVFILQDYISVESNLDELALYDVMKDLSGAFKMTVLFNNNKVKSKTYKRKPLPNPDYEVTNEHRLNSRTLGIKPFVAYRAHLNRPIEKGGCWNLVKEGLVGEFETIGEASNKLGLWGSTISKILHGKMKITGGYTFEWK